MENSNICKFCEENVGKYFCPRCNSPYCSVDCYKSAVHSDCSEAFYKECVQEEMRLREPDPQTRERMMDILIRNYENDYADSESEDSDDDESLADRLKDIDLDDAEKVWSRLTDEEQREFLDLAGGDRGTKLVPLWEPWWCKTYRISEITSDEGCSANFKSSCPKIKPDIPQLESLSKLKPSPLVFNNLMNVIAAYAMTIRYLDGDLTNSSADASSLLVGLSLNLSRNVNFDTLELAIESVSNQSIESTIISANDENINRMREDVVKLALGPNLEESSYYILSALSHAAQLFTRSGKHPQLQPSNLKTSLPPVFEKKVNISLSKNEMMLTEKKIQYYLSWVVTCYADIIREYKQFLSSNS